MNLLMALMEMDYDEDDVEAQEMALTKELGPIKDQLEKIMKKYPHAEWDDVLHWLKQ